MPLAPLSKSFVVSALWLERWVLAALSLFFAWDHLVTLRLLYLIQTTGAFLPVRLAASDAGLATGVDLADVARYGLLAVANFVVAVFLLLSRQPACPPRRIREILVPLAATYACVLFNLPGLFPAWSTTPLVPKSWQVPLAEVGLGVTAFGVLISLGGLLWLGRSLGVFVAVRRVVLAGPYRRVRHPIYSGYILSMAGFTLTGCTVRLAFLVAGTVGLLVWRARLEEQALCDASPASRRRQAVAGFFLPRWSLRRRGVGGAGVAEEPGKSVGELAPAPVLLFNARSHHG